MSWALRIDWAANFGEPVTALEVAPDGSGYRVHTRFSRFVNVPELAAMFGEIADIQTKEMLELPVPAIAGGGPQAIVAEISPAQKAFVETLVERARLIHQGGVDPKKDNMLAVTTAGRKAALDLRLVDPHEEDFPGSKVNLATHKIFAIWYRTRDTRRTQLVFCDMSVPTGGKGFSVYEDLRDKLLARGIPSNEIAFVHDYETDSAKAEIFQRVRMGQVRILMGSTARMGTGVNVQRRLIALHDLDAPWRPSDMEQRLGRGERQGNENPIIEAYRYVTNGTFDAYMYQGLERKQAFIAQVLVRDAGVRSVEDAALTALSYAEVKALASGNPIVLEKAGVDAEVLKLTRAKNQWRRERYDLQRTIETERFRLQQRQALVHATQLDLARRLDVKGDRFTIEINGERVTKRIEAGRMLHGIAEQVRSRQKNTRDDYEIPLGKFAGFDLLLTVGFRGPQLTVRGAQDYDLDLPNTEAGVMQVVEYRLSKLEESLLAAIQGCDQSENNIRLATQQLDSPFAQ